MGIDGTAAHRLSRGSAAVRWSKLRNAMEQLDVERCERSAMRARCYSRCGVCICWSDVARLVLVLCGCAVCRLDLGSLARSDAAAAARCAPTGSHARRRRRDNNTPDGGQTKGRGGRTARMADTNPMTTGGSQKRSNAHSKVTRSLQLKRRAYEDI
jgi:hypothetical protein